MKRWLRRKLQGLLQPDISLAAPPVAPALVSAPEWTPVHRAHLQQFLASPTGLALLARGHAVLADAAIRACGDPFHTSHSAARAAGFGDGLKWLESLSRASRVTEDSLQEGPMAGTATNDTPSPGETELRERLSP